MIQLFDGYLNKFIQISPEGLKELKSPQSGTPLAIVSEELQNKAYSFASVKEFQRFYKKYSRTRSLSVFQNGMEYTVFSMDNKSVQNIYAQYGTAPFPYAVFFLNFLKKHEIKEAAVLSEVINGQARVTTAVPKIGVSTEIASPQTPVMFQNFMRDKSNELRKKGFESAKFFVLGKSAQTLVPNAAVLSFEDLYTQDIGFYAFEEPVLKIKSRKNRELASASVMFAAALLLSVFSIFVFNGLKSKTAGYYLEGRQNIAAAASLRLKLKMETGKRFLYTLNKEPRYAGVISGLLRLFPKGAYVKKISVKPGSLTLVGYTGKSYRGFIDVFNTLTKRLSRTGYTISPLANAKAGFRFVIRGIPHED